MLGVGLILDVRASVPFWISGIGTDRIFARPIFVRWRGGIVLFVFCPLMLFLSFRGWGLAGVGPVGVMLEQELGSFLVFAWASAGLLFIM